MVIHNTVNISSYITYEFKNCNINSFFYIGKNSFFWLIVLIRKHPKEHTIFEIFAVHPFSSNAPDDWQEGLKIWYYIYIYYLLEKNSRGSEITENFRPTPPPFVLKTPLYMNFADFSHHPPPLYLILESNNNSLYVLKNFAKAFICFWCA